MQKRSIADQFNFGCPDKDANSLDTGASDWNLIVAASNAAAEIAEVHFNALPVVGSSNEDASAGPDAAAAGGKKGGGGTTGGGTTGGGTTGSSTGQGTTTTVLH